MSEPDHDEVRAAPRGKLPPTPLLLLAAGIVLAGAVASWWFMRSQSPPPAHPETALFRQIEEPRLLLAEVFRSYDSEAAVATPLEAAGLKVQRRTLERPHSERYPPRRITTFTVEGYRHLDCEGTLVLEFFNDRLMEADFRPDDAARYAPRLHRATPGLRRDRNGHAELMTGVLRIWSTVDLAKSKVGRTLGSDGVVLWQDTRLIAQRDDWDARFGSIPVPFKPD
ncbi:MAG: hypothetical protein V4650_11170 [Pseudomonadota bacterium]